MGFSRETFIVWKLIVTYAIKNEINEANAKYHQCNSHLSLKLFNQLSNKYQAIGHAIILAMMINFEISFDNKRMIEDADAPNTFRIPISLIFCCAK